MAAMARFRPAATLVVATLCPMTLGLAMGLMPAAQAQQSPWGLDETSFTGPRSRLAKNWQGLRPLAPTTAILVMPGHADSQGFGSGASGAAVAVSGARPMDPTISDELYWNLATVEAVVRLGQARGLNIRSYDPGVRRIANGQDPRTTWSVGKAHVQAGGYAFEIHYDAHGSAGIGSGLIPPLKGQPSLIDESLAREFGAFPLWFRDGLGAPKRGISILEIGKLEGQLEARLRNPATREQTLEAIAVRIVTALEQGLGDPRPSGGAEGAIAMPPLTPPPDVVGSVLPVQDRQASPGAW
ncbi:MAG: hypothetical protein RLZZ336_268 [Cyanobacteriota bacterium]|jgi:hypothetical protein